MITLPEIHDREELVRLVDTIGFLPFFQNAVEGFSLEDCVSPECWYHGSWEGRISWPAWDWKGEVSSAKELVYGKFFDRKAGFISKKWFSEWCNFRRDGYDFDSRYEDGLASVKDKFVIDYLTERGSCLSKELKKAGNYHKGGNVGFETVITRLQMQTYVTVEDFEYSRDKTGHVYGWGVARYALAGQYWGDRLCRGSYEKDPEDSCRLIREHFHRLLPEEQEKTILKMIRGI